MKYDSMWGIGEGVTSWPRLKEILIKTFKKYKTALREKRDSMKLTDEDDFDNHVAKMTQMCREINPHMDEEDIVLKIIRLLPETLSSTCCNQNQIQLGNLRKNSKAGESVKRT